MKKILTLVLTVLLFLAVGCTPNTPSSQGVSEVQIPEKSNTGYFVLPQHALEELEEEISRLTPEDVYLPRALKTLEYYNIDISLENISKGDNDSVYFELKLSKENNTAVFPVVAGLEYQYFEEGLPGSEQAEYINLKAAFGSTIDVTDSFITLVNGQQVTVLDIYSLEKQPVEFDLSLLGEGRIVPSCTRGDGRYAFAYYTENEKGIAFYDLDGGYINRVVVNGPDSASGLIISNRPSDTSRYNVSVISFVDTGLIFLNEEQTLIHCGRGYCLNTETAEITNDAIVTDSVWDNGRLTVYKVYRRRPADGQREYYLMAVSQQDGKTRKVYSDVDLNPGFAYDGGRKINYRVYSIRDGEITMECNYTGQKVIFDFNSGTADSMYTVSEWMLEDRYKLTDSPDGNYALYSACHSGGGDISYSNILLVNNRTKQMKYIDYIGGMYGGGSDAGFFSNGDIYVLKRDNFKVFTTDMEEEGPEFCLADKYSFGNYVDGGKKARWLVAARRDPQDYTYIAVYARVSREREDIMLDEWRMDGTYKVGFFDAYGRLIKEYDTGVDALMSSFGLMPVNMWLSGENLHMYGFVKSTDNRYFEGYININTGKYTPVKNFDG